MLNAMNLRAAITGLVFSGLAALAPLAAGQVVVLPDLGNTRLTGISDDGRTVAGVVGGLPAGNFFWNPSSGYQFPSRLLKN